MVRIRLRRVGAKAQPSYRIVVADREHPRDGRFLEVIGQYNPRTEPTTFQVDEARALHWLKVGAQPSEPVRRILNWSGTLERFERLKQGEPLDTLLQEAQQTAANLPTNIKTRRDDAAQASKRKSRKQKAAEAGTEAAAAVTA